MKRIIMFVLLFAALKVAGQTTGYLRFDTVKIMKQNGTCELYIINKTKDSLGLLTNVGGGLTQFKRARAINDSMVIIGNDTISLKGSGGNQNLQQVLNNGSTLTENETITLADSLKFTSGFVIIDSLRLPALPTSTDTTAYKPLIIDASGNVSKMVGWPNNLEWVSVADYGAKADDTAIDYTSNIKAALASGARTVQVPAGLYIITDSLHINSNQTLLGYGAKFIRKSNVSVLIINNADGVTGGYTANTNISIIGLTIDGNASVYTDPCTLIAFGHASNITIRDCDLFNAPTWHLLEINGCKNTRVENTYFHDAVLADREFLQTDMMSQSTAFPWFGPYDTVAVNGLVVTNCTFKNGNNGIGQHSVRDAYPNKNITIENCWFENLSETAIRPYNYTNCTIRNNTITNCLHGIRDYTTYNNPFKLNRGYVIEGNMITNLMRPSTTEGRGINLRWASDIVISNNIVDSIRLHAIGLDFCDTFSIINNVVRDYGQGGVGAGGVFGIAVWGSRNGNVIGNKVSNDSTSALRNAIFCRSVTNAVKNVSIKDNIVRIPGANISTMPSALGQQWGIDGNNVFVGNNIVNDTAIGNTVSITSNYTIKGTEKVISANTTSGAVTITLQPRLLNDGITIIKSAGANSLTLTPNTGTINGVSSITVDSIVTVKSDGLNYYTLSAEADTSVLATQYDILSQKEQIIGSLYQNTNFTSTTGFYNNGTTVSATGGHLEFTGGSATYTQSLELDSLHALDSWVVGGLSRIVTVGSSPGWGVKGRSTGGGNSCFGVFNTSTGKIDLVVGASTLLKSSTAAIAFSVGDTIELIVKLDKTILSAKARNKTTNSTAITVEHNFVLTSTVVFLPNTGRFAIFPSGTGGAFDVDSFSVFSKEVKNPSVVLIGNSKTRGNSVTTEGFRFGDLLNNYNRSTVITGGPSDKIEDYIARYKEILLIAGSNTKVLICGASNNIRVGQSSATYTQLYDSLVTILVNAGLDVYHTTGFYESGVNQNTLRDHIYSTYASDKIIETLTPTSESGLVFSDNIHPNDAGHFVIYNTIVNSLKLAPTNTTYDAGNTVIRNQDIVEQSAKFKLYSFGNSINGFNAPALSTPALKITTGNNNSSIGLAMNINHATNNSAIAFQRQDTTAAYIGLSMLNSNVYDLAIRSDRGNIGFGSNTSEFARLDDLGRFYINTTSSVLSSRFTVRQNSSTQAIAAFDGQRTNGSYILWSTNATLKGIMGTGDFITGAAADDIGIRSENSVINFSGAGTMHMKLRSGELNIGNFTDQGSFTLQNTGGLYQNGTLNLRGVSAPTSTYNVLVHDLTDSTIDQIPVASIQGVTSINSQTGPSINISGDATNGISVSAASNTVTVSGNTDLESFGTDANNSGTSETDLYSHTLAANKLTLNGKGVRFRITGTNNDATATAQIKGYFAGTSIFDSGALTMSAAGDWVIEMEIQRTTSTTAAATVTFSCANTTVTLPVKYTALTSQDWTTTNIFKVTGTAAGGGGGSNDITAHAGKVVFVP